MNLKVDIEQKEAVIQVFVSGEIDAYTAPQLKGKVMPFAQQDDVSIIVDVSEVSFLDSMGLSVFVALFKNVRAHSGEFEIVGLSYRIKRLFEITGLANIIHISSQRGECNESRL